MYPLSDHVKILQAGGFWSFAWLTRTLFNVYPYATSQEICCGLDPTQVEFPAFTQDAIVASVLSLQALNECCVLFGGASYDKLVSFPSANFLSPSIF